MFHYESLHHHIPGNFVTTQQFFCPKPFLTGELQSKNAYKTIRNSYFERFLSVCHNRTRKQLMSFDSLFALEDLLYNGVS